MIEYTLESTERRRSRIVVGTGLVAEVPAMVAEGRYRFAAVLAQPASAGLAERLSEGLRRGGVGSAMRVLPDRDDAKTLQVVEGVLTWLNGLRLTRGDALVAVGGGALTDVAGFVAAIYLRGLDSVYVPTTLLGAVDAAIGGKTGVNVGGKNLAGVFRHPVLVVVDGELLQRLPVELIREGAAEILKAGLIADPEIVEAYERHGLDAPLDTVLARAIAVKVQVVGGDFSEAGERAILNYGHTVGHAVEIAAGLSHGHAVAVGMVAAGRASQLVTGFSGEERQRSVIEGLGLPTSAPGLAVGDVLDLVALDKKRSGRQLRMVLLEDVGRAGVRPVDDATVRRALAAVGIT